MNLNRAVEPRRAAVSQWQRAEFIIDQLKAADQASRDLRTRRSAIKKATQAKFGSCHDCLLLAVYGLYKNGYISDTTRERAVRIDLTGFNGRHSLDIEHAFDALERLKENDELSASALRESLGGDQSIYSFVVHYHANGLIRKS
jgi:hypothetical protein